MRSPVVNKVQFGTLVLVAAAMTACAGGKDFYVQESVKLAKVTVHECSVATFRNIDTDKTAKRQVCRDVVLDASQKTAWQRLNGNQTSTDDSEVAEEPTNAE